MLLAKLRKLTLFKCTYFNSKHKTNVSSLIGFGLEGWNWWKIEETQSPVTAALLAVTVSNFMPIYKVTFPKVGVNTVLQTSIRLEISEASFCYLQPSLTDTGQNSEWKNLTAPEAPSISVASPSETANKEINPSLDMFDLNSKRLCCIQQVKQ